MEGRPQLRCAAARTTSTTTPFDTLRCSTGAESNRISRFEIRKAFEAAAVFVISEILVPESSIAKEIKDEDDGRESREGQDVSNDETDREAKVEKKQRKKQKQKKQSIAEYIDPVVGYSFEFDPTRSRCPRQALS